MQLGPSLGSIRSHKFFMGGDTSSSSGLSIIAVAKGLHQTFVRRALLGILLNKKKYQTLFNDAMFAVSLLTRVEIFR